MKRLNRSPIRGQQLITIGGVAAAVLVLACVCRAADHPTPAKTPDPSAEETTESSLPRVPLDQVPVRRSGMFEEVETPSPPGAVDSAGSSTTSVLEVQKSTAAPEAPRPAVSMPVVKTKPEASPGVAPLAANELAGTFATQFDDPPPQPAATIDGAGFNGVQPGETSLEDLTKKWGEGKKTGDEKTETVYSYAADPFPRIDVTLVDDVVSSIMVYLAAPATSEALIKQLKLDDVEHVDVHDETGQLLGLAFPERGVFFTYATGGQKVSHVVLDQIDLESFVLRAENGLQTRCRTSFADLGYVLSEKPEHAHALSLRAKLLADLARYDEALAAIDSALTVEPNNPDFRLRRSELLGRQGKFDEAIQATKEVLATPGIAKHWEAKALCQCADQLAAAPSHDYKQALEYHMAALKAAEPLAADKHAEIRRLAKHVLVEANLGVAHDIACGYWSKKERIVSQWLEHAKSHTEDLIAKEGADTELRLHLARGALAACAGADGKVDPVPWTRIALQSGKQLIAAANDPWRKARIEWELGLALSDSLAADDSRGVTQHTLANSTLTVTHLEAGAKGRRETPDDLFRLGRMYYRVGSLHAVGRNDHKTAVAWYEKARPLLDRPLPATQQEQQGRYGEWLVSMGISYWEIGRQQEALELTDDGVRQVENAVEKKLLEDKALTVPYNNLSSMHDALGNKAEARDFAELASRLERAEARRR